MTNKEFIKKYGKFNFESIIDSVNINLNVLLYSKQIPKFIVLRKKGIVLFRTKEQTTTMEIAKIYYMKDKELIEYITERRCNDGG